MRDYLVFQLYGTMASWGTIAVGESRHSDASPSKSAVMGIVAAALGIPRSDDAVHRQLCVSYGFGVKVISAGTLMRDYHTTQAPPKQKKVIHHTRRDELKGGKLGTTLSSREYRCDNFAIIALWALGTVQPYSLEELVHALACPKYTLYLGRKSCPLGLPLQARVLKADTLKNALDAQVFDSKVNELFLPKARVRYCWEDVNGLGIEAGMKPDQQIQRHDICLSRKRWQFESRAEHVHFGKEG
ncbi:MAG: type I-E CRISPR-associated protein Cas5/CasD [Desulfobacteraceae bacterium]|nr:type I-E CRISPR-associated protein Cas5/CasD [Desulfobacteraceae bacterium]